MPVEENNTVKNVTLTEEQKELVSKSQKIHQEQFGNKTWFGRCIFLSWYCSKGTCDFCFRSTQKHKIAFADNARRTKKSILTEAIITKTNNWKIEFLTGGYGVYPFSEILNFAKLCHDIFKEKIWINLGILEKEELEQLKPYVEGIVASLETPNPDVHKKTCPDKNFEEYLNMLDEAKKLGFKTGITIVLGIGETTKDYELAKKIIQKHNITRITYYALRPVKGTPYKNGPEPEDVVEWIARTRIDFPEIEIMAGTAVTRIPEIKYLLQAGANGFTKLPATKLFGTSIAKKIIQETKSAKRELESEFLKLNTKEWEEIANNLKLNEKEKTELLNKLQDYKEMMTKQ